MHRIRGIFNKKDLKSEDWTEKQSESEELLKDFNGFILQKKNEQKPDTKNVDDEATNDIEDVGEPRETTSKDVEIGAERRIDDIAVEKAKESVSKEDDNISSQDSESETSE